MSKERARRRTEREAEAVRLEGARAARAARETRRQRRGARVRSLVPRTSRPEGPLARRRRLQNRAVLALFLGVQGLAWLFGLSGTARFGVFALSLLITPVVLVLAFDRR
ncbi:MAG: hypothetical protein ABIS86_15700 [Streptosporangiaceae bacterium]